MTLVLTLLLSTQVAQVPSKWSCPADRFGDQVCDCGCGAVDSDCPDAYFSNCARVTCPVGEVPWEHENSSCMPSACGDGWKASTEACDDGEALASGGCNANCTSVNVGFQCGERATKCAALPADAGTQPTIAADAGTVGTEAPARQGCSSVTGSVVVGSTLALRLLRRRRVKTD